MDDALRATPSVSSLSPLRIFFSYSRIDLPIVQEVYLWLKQEVDVHIWFDQGDIRPAKQWLTEIKLGLDHCNVVILFASKFSLASVNVKDEWLYALKTLKKPVYVWLLDTCELDPQFNGCPILDLRADPFNIDDWRLGLQQIADKLQGPTATLQRAVIPEYVDFYLRRSRQRLIRCSLLAILGFLGFLFFPVSGYWTLWAQTGLFTAYVVGNRWHSFRIRRRLTPWSDFILYLDITLGAYLPLFVPLGYWANYLAAVHRLDILIYLTLFGCALALGFGRRLTISQVTWSLGKETFYYRSAPIQEYLQSSSLIDRVVRETVRKRKLCGWCPAFHFSGPLRLARREESNIAAISEDTGMAIALPYILLLYHSLDTYIAHYLSAQLSDPDYQVNTSILEPNFKNDGLVHQFAGTVIFILSKSSVANAVTLLDNKQILRRMKLLFVLIEKPRHLPYDLQMLQWIDASNWNFDKACAAIRQTVRDEPIDFTGTIDARANMFGLRGIYLSWLFVLLYPPLLGIYNSIDLKSYNITTPTLIFYSIAVALLLTSAVRKYTLKFYGAVLLLSIVLLWAQYIFTDFWEDRSNTLPLTLVSFIVALTCLWSNTLRRTQIASILRREQAQQDENSAWSFFLLEPYKRFEWHLFIPTLLSWGILLATIIY